METIARVEIDWAKKGFQLTAVDTRGAILKRKRSGRSGLSLVHPFAFSGRHRWRQLRGFRQRDDVVANARFMDGVDEETDQQEHRLNLSVHTPELTVALAHVRFLAAGNALQDRVRSGTGGKTRYRPDVYCKVLSGKECWSDLSLDWPGVDRRMNVVARTLAAVAVGALLVPLATAQDGDWWREMAARDAQRAREAQRAELIRAQYERRRSMAHARLQSGEGSTLYASTLSSADVQLSCPVVPAPGMRNVIELVIDGRHDPLSSAGGVADRLDMVAPLGWSGMFTPTLPRQGPVLDYAAAHADLLVSDAWGASASADTIATHAIPFLPSASDAHARQGIAHVLNRSAEAGEVGIVAIDDSGRRYGPLRLTIGPNETAHVTSADLENGNADKGLFGATGPGVGDWRLELSSDLDIEALSYVRAWDGLVTAMHDVAPSEGTRHRVPIFIPADNWDQESRLRLINPGREPAEVAITGIDSRGEAPGDGVAVTLPAGASLTYTAAELESGRGAGLRGSLGDGTGEWRLIVESEQPLLVMSLVSSPTGHLTNLSTVPLNEAQGIHGVPLLPAASDPLGRQGLVRVINRTDTAGELRVKAHDDTQWDYAPLVLPIGAGEAVHFTSNDLEQGNPGKGLAGGTGAGQGDWRLELTSDVDIEVLSYVNAWDGLLTAMHDLAPSEGTRHRVAMFNPQGSPEQESVLRLINPGIEPAGVAISGVDTQGESLGDGVAVTLPAGASMTYTAAELQTGTGAGLRGSLGEGTGEWQLIVESGQPLQVMSLLSSPTGHLSNLSTVPVLVTETVVGVFATDTETSDTETVEDVFGTEVSPIVQAKCILCHRAGGFPADTPISRLQFSPSTVEGHAALNLAVFEALIAVLGEDDQVEDPATYILNKVQGVDHGGGPQAPAGTDDYKSLERFLGMLGEAVAPVAITPETLFEGVTMESARSTLRRAAIVFAGRVPTQAEYAAIQDAGEEDDASEEALRAAVRGLMTGPQFHEFLIRASNDSLFTDRDYRILDNDGDGFVAFPRKIYSLNQLEGSIEAANRYVAQAQYGFRRAPLELIAHVVENDLPYTEILTADYIMANPQAAEAYGAATTFENPENAHEFKPSEVATYYRPCEGMEVERREFGAFVVDPGPCATEFPHAGILNTKVFLQRYPTTVTNRNRARSRWTYYHFLGLDIEKSASRTTDPVALADTNNPTMNNPACTVCHIVMDPVAGAFQNYGDDGMYRDQWGGLDSLDEFYKYAPSGRIDIPVDVRTKEQSVAVLGTVSLFAGQDNELGLKNVRTFEGDTKLHLLLGNVAIRDLNGMVVHRFETKDLAPEASCGNARDESYFLNDCREMLLLPLTVEADGEYSVELEAWVLEEGKKGTTLQAWMPGPFYRQADTWYRDMRSPGFDGGSPATAHNSLQWLAQQIVADERFAEAAVSFWWPAVMGAEVAEPPENENDADFQGLLLASNAQAAEVTRLANGFRSGFHDGSPHNLKDLLVEIVVSKWFRAESVAEDEPVRAIGLGNVGARRLLTPEELARKTLALAGFQWGRSRGSHSRPETDGQSHLTNADRGYALLYGGIDSDGVIERARDLTSVMAGVAQSHALRSSYPIVMRELYLLPEEQRRLFAGVDVAVTPTFEFGDTFAIAAHSRADGESLSLRGHLSAGSKTASITFLNDFYQEEPREDRNIRLDRLDVRNAAGEIVETIELEELERLGDCNYPVGEHFALNCTGSLDVEMTVPVDGDYTIEVVTWADQAGDELPMLQIAIHSDTENSVGANRIKSKLVELYDKLHGTSVATDSVEVQDAYALFVEVWERKRGTYGDHFVWNEEYIRIDWASDQHFFVGIADDLWQEELHENGNPLGWDWDRVHAFFDDVDWSDPQAVARTWTVVLAYLMMDYRYLYL